MHFSLKNFPNALLSKNYNGFDFTLKPRRLDVPYKKFILT